MKKTSLLILFITVFFACSKQQKKVGTNTKNWQTKTTKINSKDSLNSGKTYLSIYSQIHSISEHKKHNLTAMVSLRNTSETDTIYIIKAKYYDTHGKKIRTYFENPIYLAPMETSEIIINEADIIGGTGSNFIFEWKTPKGCSAPLFEGIMNSTMGQQGLSFTTQGIRIK
ncbi:DUF3124 domain-containing protein [Tenacibaculum aestuariivivum]|uniref:DUF3124 domain-containing protein n=1 Tax=Tenacibaculum aestuariivivum TaxID=2006131 RepID=UPI003AB27589